MNRYCQLIVFLFFSASSMAQQKITVSAFYSDYVAKFDRMPDTLWSHDPYIQIRILHEFSGKKRKSNYDFKNKHYTLNFVSGAILGAIELETATGTYHPGIPSRMLDIMNDTAQIPMSLSYTYSLPSVYGIKYWPQAFYANPYHEQSWYVIDKNNIDSIYIEFNINPSLFYLRTSKPLYYVDRKPMMKLMSNELEPSFYLFYLPAYNHYTFEEDGKFIDLLVENIDSSKSEKYGKIEYYDSFKERDSLGIERMKSTKKCLDEWFGRESSPDTLYIVKSIQSKRLRWGDFSRLVTSSWAERVGGYSLLCIDSEFYFTTTMMHELMHCYVKKFSIEDMNDDYEINFFKESLIEYLTCFLYNRQFGATTFSEKEEFMRGKEKTIAKARNLLKKNKNNSVSFAGEDHDTYWIYYDLLPCRLHEYAERNGNEERFVETIISYLKKLDENHAPSFKEFSEYMKENGFRNVDGIYKL